MVRFFLLCTIFIVNTHYVYALYKMANKVIDKQYIKEIKAGQTGYGLLIERDGGIKGNPDVIQQIKEDINHHDKFVIPDHFIVNAVLQKYGIKNANGRIYPEAILKREVERYINECINGFGNTAIGALDHPECQLADTQILTEKGWKYISDVKVGENILTVTQDKKIEIKPILRTIAQPYKGKLIHLKGRMVDIKVTPNHKFPVLDRNKKFKGFYTAEELYNRSVPDQDHCSLFRTGDWEGANDTEVIIPRLTDAELSIIHRKDLKEKYSQDLHIPMEVWMKFMGIYLSEGDANFRRTGNKHGCYINIHQVKPEICVEIESMLEDFPLDYIKQQQKRDNYIKNIYTIYDMRLAKYLDKIGNCYAKYVPYEIKKQNKEMLRVFYDWFVMGDGRGRGIGPGQYVTDDVFSTSRQLVMDLNEIQLKIGYCGAYHEEDRHIDRYIEGRLIKAENSQNMFFSLRSLTKHLALNKKSLSITEEDYDGMVYCVEVENHTFYTMDNSGHCLWSGNSSSLSLHDVAHKILNLRWEGHTLLGELELHLSPGYRRYGICSTSGDLAANLILDDIQIGVSSRALGNVVQKLGALIVDDSLELIGWDIVATPSTPNAWITMNAAKLQPFIENKEEDKENKEKINETLENAKKLVSLWG